MRSTEITINFKKLKGEALSGKIVKTNKVKYIQIYIYKHTDIQNYQIYFRNGNQMEQERSEANQNET